MKNVITREFIEKELRFYNTADIRSTLVLCGVLSLFFVPFTVGVIYGFFTLLKTTWLKILFSVLVSALTSAPVWLNLLSLRTSLKNENYCKTVILILRYAKYNIKTKSLFSDTRKNSFILSDLRKNRLETLIMIFPLKEMNSTSFTTKVLQI